MKSCFLKLEIASERLVIIPFLEARIRIPNVPVIFNLRFEAKRRASLSSTMRRASSVSIARAIALDSPYSFATSGVIKIT